MAKRKAENQVVKKAPATEVDFILLADLGNNLIIASVDVKMLREQDKNAHLMKPEMFRQLSENIKKRGGLESIPFCALVGKRIEIVSGHHRIRAAKEAGIERIYVMIDTSGLTRSQIVAKQLAHNALNGFDDKATLRELALMIEEVDDMIESYIGKDILKQPEEELEKLISPVLEYDWKEIQMIFLPHQVSDMEKLVATIDGNKDYIGAGHIDQFEKLLNTLSKYQKFTDIKNIGAAIHMMIEVANRVMSDAEFDGKEEWVPLSRILGNAAIPKESAEKVKKVLDQMEKNEEIEKNKRWKGLELMADKY